MILRPKLASLPFYVGLESELIRKEVITGRGQELMLRVQRLGCRPPSGSVCAGEGEELILLGTQTSAWYLSKGLPGLGLAGPGRRLWGPKRKK